MQARTGSSAVILTFGWKLVILCLNLANGIMVVRNLGPTGRGEQSVIAFWPLLLASILEFGLPCSVIYYARSRADDKRKFYGSSLLLCVFFSALAVVIGIVGIPHWITKFNQTTIHTAQCFMFFAPFSMMSFFVLAILDAEHNFSLSNYLRNLPTLFTTLGLITLIFTRSVSPITTALMYFLPSAAFLTYILLLILLRYRPSIHNFVIHSKLLMSYGLRVYGSILVGTFGQQIDQLLVVGLLTPTDLGVYTVALSGSRILTILPYSAINVLLPKIVGRGNEDINRLVTFVAKLSLYATSGAGLILAAIMPVMMPWIFGKALSAGIPVAQILIIEVIFATTTWILMQTYLALNRPAIVTLFQTISLSLCVPLMFVFIPRFGLKGAALALLCSTLIRFVCVILGYALVLKIPLPNFWLKPQDVQLARGLLKPQ